MNPKYPLAIGLLLTGAQPLLAADVTLTVSDGFGNSSFNAAGNWDSAAAPTAGNDYFTGDFTLRTPPDGDDHTFQGDSLTVNNTNGYAQGLFYKGLGNTGTITVNNLILDGGMISHGQGSADNFNLDGDITVVSDSEIYAKQGPINVLADIAGSATITNPGSDGTASILTLLSPANTFNGNLVNNGRFTLADDAVLNFVIGASGVNNAISGTGAATAINGDFAFDVSSAGTTLGDSWQIVAADIFTHGETFTVIGFTDPDDFAGRRIWIQAIGGGLFYAYNADTGILSVTDDSDTDGLSDAWELDNFGNLDEDGSGDFDFDDATNEEEEAAGTDPDDDTDWPDTDTDGLKDAWEVIYFGDIGVSDGSGDFDGDFSADLLEFESDTFPDDASDWPDADFDNLSDGWEEQFATGSNQDGVIDPGELDVLKGDAGQGGPGSANPDGDDFDNEAEMLAGSDPNDPDWTPMMPKLIHRWSFNGDLSDSVGSSDAQILNDSAADLGNSSTIGANGVTLGGGAKGTSDYVNLGSNLLQALPRI